MAGSRNIRAGRAYVELYADQNKLSRGLMIASHRMKAFGRQAADMGRQMMRIGTMAAAPFAISTRFLITFDDQMRTVKAVTQATADQFQRLYDLGKKLGRTTSFTAGQVGGGMVSLGRAGFSPAEIEAMTGHILNLARATGTELADAAEIAGATLRGFGLEAAEIGRVCDVLTATANTSSQTLTDMGEALVPIRPLANAAGETLEDTAKTIGTLANMQIKGTLAATAYKNILLRLADPNIRNILQDQFGIDALKSGGDLRKTADILSEIGRAMAGLGTGEQMSLADTLFGKRAIAGALSLSTKQFERLNHAIDNATGAAKRNAQTMDENIGGVWRKFLSMSEGIAIAIGEAISGSLQQFGKDLTEVGGKITFWIEHNQEAIISMMKWTAAVIAGGAALVILGTTITSIGVLLGVLAKSVVLARTALTSLAAHPGAFGLLALAAAAGTVLYAMRQLEGSVITLSHAKARLVDDTRRLTEASRSELAALEELGKKARMSDEELATAHQLIKSLETSYGAMGLSIDGATRSLEGLADAQARFNKEADAREMAALKARMKEIQQEMGRVRDKFGDIPISEWAASWLASGQTEAREGALTSQQRTLEMEARKTLREMGAVKARQTAGADAATAAAAGSPPLETVASELQDMISGMEEFAGSRNEAMERLRMELERANIEGTLSGSARDSALLDLDRREAIARNRDQFGVNSAMERVIRRTFAMRERIQAGAQQAGGLGGPRGIFSIARLQSLLAGPQARHQKDISANTKLANVHLAQIVRAAENGGLAFGR